MERLFNLICFPNKNFIIPEHQRVICLCVKFCCIVYICVYICIMEKIIIPLLFAIALFIICRKIYLECNDLQKIAILKTILFVIGVVMALVLIINI